MVELRYAEARGTLSEEKWSLKRGKELTWLGVEVGKGRGRGGRFWADSLARAQALGRNEPETARNERGERESREGRRGEGGRTIRGTPQSRRSPHLSPVCRQSPGYHPESDCGTDGSRGSGVRQSNEAGGWPWGDVFDLEGPQDTQGLH